MNRNELAHALAESEGLTDVLAIRLVSRIFEIVGDAIVEGDTVVIRNFGRFEARTRSPLRRINPKTGAEIMVPTRRTVGFKSSPAMRAKVNGEREGQESST